jgi:hypothetical protein
LVKAPLCAKWNDERAKPAITTFFCIEHPLGGAGSRRPRPSLCVDMGYPSIQIDRRAIVRDHD